MQGLGWVIPLIVPVLTGFLLRGCKRGCRLSVFGSLRGTHQIVGSPTVGNRLWGQSGILASLSMEAHPREFLRMLLTYVKETPDPHHISS